MSIHKVYYGITAKNYEKQRAGKTWAAEERAFVELINQVINDTSVSESFTVLDLPCGTGRWIPIIFNYNVKNYVGVDISSDMLTQAKKKNKLSSLNYSFVQKGWQNYLYDSQDKFDLVICTRFLGHWRKKDAIQIMRKLAEKSNKYFIVQVRANNTRLDAICEALGIIKRGPLTVCKKLKKSNRLTRSHMRSTFMHALSKSGMILEKTITIRKDRFSSFEYWLAKKQ